jgi:crotonobetainyl-CoA:carnitine CoA-transferase CaiB-like acyl-CoA transferase
MNDTAPKIYLETKFMKTVQDYMSDPRLLNDPGMVEALEPVREIHAIRLKIQDETANMTTAEKIDLLNREAEAFLAPMGKTLCYDLVGRGRIQ